MTVRTESNDQRHWSRHLFEAIVAGTPIRPLESAPSTQVTLPGVDDAGDVPADAAAETPPLGRRLTGARPLAPEPEDVPLLPGATPAREYPLMVSAAALREALIEVNARRDLLRPESALILTDMLVKGDLDCDNLTIPVPVVLTGCRFDSPITARRSLWHSLTVRTCDLAGIDLTEARVRYDVDLSGGGVAGSVVLAAAVIMGNLHLANMVLHPDLDPALDMDHIIVRKQCTIGGGKMSAFGEVRARYGSFRSSLSFRKMQVRGQRRTALRFDGCTVAHRLSLRGLSATGTIRLDDARVLTELSLTGSTISAVDGLAVTLRRSVIWVLSLDVGAVVRGTVDLTDAMTNTLRCDASSRPSTLADVKVTAGGWSVRRIAGAPLDDAEIWTRWLRDASLTHPDQPWVEVEKALQAADAVVASEQVHAAHHAYRLSHAPAASRSFRRLDQWVFAGGAVPRRLAAVCAATMLGSALLVTSLAATALDDFTPAALSSVQMLPEPPPGCTTPVRASLPDECFVDAHSRLNPLLFGLEAAMPWPPAQPTWKPSTSAAGGLLAGWVDVLTALARLSSWALIVMGAGWLWTHSTASRFWQRLRLRTRTALASPTAPTPQDDTARPSDSDRASGSQLGDSSPTTPEPVPSQPPVLDADRRADLVDSTTPR